MVSTQILERERRLSGLPSGVSRRWWQRMLRSPLFWLTVVLVPLFVVGLWDQYAMMTHSETFEDGTEMMGLTNESIRKAAWFAAWTALAYTLLFVWLDRFRGQNVLVWLLTFGWGAAISTWVSIYVNTWAGRMMSTTDANSDMGSRAAVFSAPFVEEAAKATILFLLLILVRTQVVSRLSIVALSGLSAVGFAFVENIIYYARVWMYSTHTIEVGDPVEAMMEIVLLRGVYTSFAHPLFTMLTATGMSVAMSSRSKIVRVVAPLAGFLASVAGHMLFNGASSTRDVGSLMIPWIMALVLVLITVISLVISVAQQAKLIRVRLEDYHRAGWLSQRDTEVFSKPFTRMRLLLVAAFRGPRMWWRTATLMRRVTQLAYLRNHQVRGTVAAAGDLYGRELLHQIDELRTRAIADPRGLPIIPRRPKKADRREARR
ncbi:PrsW family intramembrane metalloprotease [Tessaracoccus caeni]|uniref:PrsW family intramembrane metalloprotease n=1 Tax=Tessaracoccus caeni TaxID=3031239 RepID=UPI0023DC0DDE|nr:PrsW family intramembrane metalloprotease [Tessaracoccus caeni]MDF1487780.1 PrsW family intramembrane metalloprotease [Tessaracoccus caeni]